MTVGVEINALSDAIRLFERIPEVTGKAASIAINQTLSRGGLNLARRTILDQVAFPRDYLSGDRFGISQYATPNNLEGAIVGRKRATSLARFAQGGVVGRQAGGVKVTVRNGQGTQLRNAWLVRLKAGASLAEDAYNIGLAVRVKPGDSIVGKKSVHKSWLVKPDATRGGVALLYGPSVDQVFRDVADDIAEPVGEMVSDEFFRQINRLLT